MATEVCRLVSSNSDILNYLLDKKCNTFNSQLFIFKLKSAPDMNILIMKIHHGNSKSANKNKSCTSSLIYTLLRGQIKFNYTER